MANLRWKDSMKFFRSHMDPEREEHLRQITIGNSLSPKHPQSLQYNWRLSENNIESKRMQFKALLPASYPEFGSLWHAEPQRLPQTDNNVRKILELAKSINHDNKEAGLKKQSELVELVEEFHKQYQSLYSLYDDLKEGVKKNVNVKEEDNSSSSSSSSASVESDSYYSPDETSIRSHSPRLRDSGTPRAGTSHIDDTTSEVVKEALNVEPVSSSSKVEDMDGQKLMSNSSLLSEKLAEREKELSSLTEAHQVLETETSAKIKELDGLVSTLKIELENLIIQNGELVGKTGVKENEVKKMGEENLVLVSKISELESMVKEKGDEICAVLKKFNDNDKLLMGKVDDLMGEVNNLENEADSLRFQKGKLEQLLSEANKGLEQMYVLQQELEKKSQEMSDCLVLVESLKEKLECKTADEKGVVEERKSLKMQIKDLEMEMNSLLGQKSINHEAEQSKLDNEKLDKRIFQLEGKLEEKENELSTLKKKIKIIENEKSNEIMTLQQKCDSVQTEKEKMKENYSILLDKISEQEKAFVEREDEMSKLNQELPRQAKVRFTDPKSSSRIAERKMEELAEEFRKKFEDSIRLLSRRVRVAELLHAENKEWYKNTKDKFEQVQRENEAAFQKAKIMMVIVSETLAELETMGLRFAECMNRISKAACELNFAKDWVKRKNAAIQQVKEDFDNLLAQLDDKEEEVLGSRQKVWKLENKVRELEKMVKENEEGMMVLKEEKREAIRQLCVWIDYHRGRNDFLKKAFSELTARNQVRPT